jgi:MYXO-CTERM domain-containing protein
MLATSPSLTGSSPLAKTIGMVAVAALAAIAASRGEKRRRSLPRQ